MISLRFRNNFLNNFFAIAFEYTVFSACQIVRRSNSVILLLLSVLKKLTKEYKHDRI